MTNGQTVTLTGVPDPGQQFISYIGWGSSGPTYAMRTNPAQLRFGAIGVSGSQTVRQNFAGDARFVLTFHTALVSVLVATEVQPPAERFVELCKT